MLKSLVVAFSLSAVAGAAAQTARTPVAQPPDMKNFQTAMIAAQAAALRPGDEALGCEALQKEIITTMNDPSIQAYAAKTNAAYAKELAVRDKTKTAMTPQAAAALAAALAPSMAMAGLGGAGLTPGQPVTPEQIQQAMLAQMNQLVVIMPVMMRSQRVTQLAMVKNCTWATGAGLGLYPGGLPPGVAVPR